MLKLQHNDGSRGTPLTNFGTFYKLRDFEAES